MRFLIFFIFIFALTFRVYGINWDAGFHLHPDERAIIMFTAPLFFPQNITDFLSPASSWNPHFFAYGNFPLYLLKIIATVTGILINPLYAEYAQMNIVGRLISALFDLGSIYMLFLIAKKLFTPRIGILAAFLYAMSVLPIQLSHFYAVDTLLTFFILVTLYQLLRFYETPTKSKALLIGCFFGLSLATKTSAIVLLVAIISALSIDFLLLFLKQPHKISVWGPHVPKTVKTLVTDGLIIVLTTIGTFFISEPYALIDFKTFWSQNMEQLRMTRDAFTFPYTLQYAGKIPYFYELKNIFLWGQGPILATFSFLGALYVTLLLVHPHLRGGVAARLPASGGAYLGGEIHEKQTIIILTFFWAYFLTVGNFAIGFMRYMLPLYPLLCLFAAVLIFKLFSILKTRNQNPLILNTLNLILYTSLLVWPVSFLHIYTKPTTRIQASTWINQNIPQGETVAVEHWDDALPLVGQQDYSAQTLTLYDPDTEEKWETINDQLRQTDYIILASNRLYAPLQKLTDCEKLPQGRCYKETASYYQKLFNGSLGFEKVAEFTSYPTLEIGNWKLEIDDSSADESFTVYDHPKVMIFKK